MRALLVLTGLICSAVIYSTLAMASPVKMISRTRIPNRIQRRSAHEKNAEILSFRDWKAQRIANAYQSLVQARLENAPPSSEANHKLIGSVEVTENNKVQGTLAANGNHLSDADSEVEFEPAARVHQAPENPENLVHQAERNLRIARELSVTDYFVLYLRLQSKDAIRRAARSLTRSELADILIDYRRVLKAADPQLPIPPSPIPNGSDHHNSSGSAGSGNKKPLSAHGAVGFARGLAQGVSGL